MSITGQQNSRTKIFSRIGGLGVVVKVVVLLGIGHLVRKSQRTHVQFQRKSDETVYFHVTEQPLYVNAQYLPQFGFVVYDFLGKGERRWEQKRVGALTQGAQKEQCYHRRQPSK